MGFSLRSCSSFFLVLAIIFTQHTLQYESCIQKERLALLQIKQHFRSSSIPVEDDLFPSWGRSHGHHNCCSWERVTCRGRYITQLDLSYLVDPNLDFIDECTNTTIKPWSLNLTIFHQFERLEYLSVRGNRIGRLDQNEALCKLSSNIQVLGLGYNQMVGKISGCISNLTFLQGLYLEYNEFSGNIPPGICELKYLERLYLGDNGLNGDFPSCIGNLTSLLHLYLGNNQFSGEIPSGICELKYLKELHLNGNRFNGVPSCIGNLTSLVKLDMGYNQFSGEILSVYGSWAYPTIKFQEESLPHYATFHHLSTWMGSLTHLKLLNMQGNNLQGPIPTTLCNLSSLLYLDLRGHIPYEVSTFSSLVSLQLQGNQLTGNIPVWINKLFNLTVLQLGNNRLHGMLPDQLCSLEFLNVMVVSSNQISGSIPPCLQNVSFGIIQIDPTNLYMLGLDLTVTTKNKITEYFGNIAEQMSELDLSGNQLSGVIPSELGYLEGLHCLNLSRNNLSGTIPKSFSKLSNIESLDLSNNSLSGEIPSELVSLNFLAVFNVSYNNLSGNVPMKGQFGSFDFYNYEGNPFLHGYGKCPICAAGGEEDEESSVFDWVIFFSSFGATYVTVLLTFVGVLLINPQWRRAWCIFLDYHMLGWFYRLYD